jgi:hypothetical protein
MGKPIEATIMSKWITLRYHKAGSNFTTVDESRLQQYTDMQAVSATSPVAQMVSLCVANGSATATPVLLANGSGHQTNLVFTQYIIDNFEPVRLFIKDPDAYFANTTAFPDNANNNGVAVKNGFASAGWSVTVVDRNY